MSVDNLVKWNGIKDKNVISAGQKLVLKAPVFKVVARRLIRTEANYMSGQGKLKCWIEQGVEYYVLVATLDLRTFKICQEQDGKKYKMSEAKVNVNYPPFHPWCRSIARAWFNERTLSGKRFANDPISGERFEISHASSYEKREQMLIDRHGKEDLNLARKKVENFNADVEQFNRYKKVLEKDGFSNTLDDFQDIKYSDSAKYEELKKKYLQLLKKIS